MRWKHTLDILQFYIARGASSEKSETDAVSSMVFQGYLQKRDGMIYPTTAGRRTWVRWAIIWWVWNKFSPNPIARPNSARKCRIDERSDR